ncbi:MAG: transglutaminase domain-containing protein [Acutalibacteraceae bacterium]|nr:transglutaminase domain-containing protein [Acutalibacteraceae bacterium]
MITSKLTRAIECLFIFLLTVCPIHCLSSSFGIEINSAIILVFSAMFTLLFAIITIYQKEKGKYALSMGIFFAVFIVVGLFAIEILSAQLNYAVNCVLAQYSRFLPVFSRVSFSIMKADNATAVFVALSFIVSGLLALFIMRVRLILPAIIIPIIITVPCFILINTMPNHVPLFIMIATLFALYISAWTHQVNVNHSGMVSLIALAVIAGTMFVVYSFNPQSLYQRNQWQDDLLDTINSTINNSNFNIWDLFTSPEQNAKKEVDLSQVGPMEQQHKKIMTITSGFTGELYLRGVAYANYENNKWTMLTDQQKENYPKGFNFNACTKSDDTKELNLNITTEKREEVLYTPYYPTSFLSPYTEEFDILTKNDARRKNYDISMKPCSIALTSAVWDEPFGCYANPFNFYYDDISNSKAYRNFVHENYLSVPEEVKEELIAHAYYGGFTEETYTEYIVYHVREYVKNCVQYSLDTPSVPEGKDIALWLLNESGTGYCVHFATTATLMLRSLGIPARYVTGYYVYAEADKPTVVTSDNAHAWVEYFVGSIGWVPFEATPADFSRILAETSENTTATQSSIQTPTEANQQSSTQPSTQSTTQKTTQSTNPTENTQPTNSTLPHSVTIIKNPSGGSGTGNAIFGFAPIVYVVFVILASVIILLLRRVITLLLRKKLFQSGDYSSRVKNLYRYMVKLAKHSGATIPNNIKSIAEKSRFGKDSITQEELDTILSFTKDQQEEITLNTPLLKKLYFKYILVLV